MKLLFISHGHDFSSGEMARAAETMTAAMNRGGTEATLVTQDKSLPNALRLWRKVRNHDGVLLNSPLALTAIWVVFAAKLARRPLMIFSHEVPFHSNGDRGKDGGLNWRNWLKRLKNLKKLQLRLICRSVEQIVFPSDLARLNSGLEAICDPRKLIVIPLPVFDESAVFARRMERNQDAVITVGFWGQIYPNQNLKLLVSALAAVPRLQLVIGGNSDARLTAEIIALIERKNLTERVAWQNYSNDDSDTKNGFFAQIDILAVPAAYDPFSLIAAEAMARGIPILLSPTVGIAEWVEREGGGIIVPPRPDALAVALARLNWLELEKWGQQAQGLARTHFSYRAFVTSLEREFSINRSSHS